MKLEAKKIVQHPASKLMTNTFYMFIKFSFYLSFTSLVLIGQFGWPLKYQRALIY